MKSLEDLKQPSSIRSSSFLRYAHNFRCFAILTIVAGHIVDYLQWSNEKSHLIASILIENGTVYFVFIAGFLFQHLSHKFKYHDYLNKKLQYVISPYVLMSLPAIVAWFLGLSTLPQYIWFHEKYAEFPEWTKVLLLYFTGAQLAPFWFIPMIFGFYVISPILLRMDRYPVSYRLLPVLLLISILVPREDTRIALSFVHFFSIYILGMFCSHYKERLFLVVKKIWPMLAALAALVCLAEILIEPRIYPLNTMTKAILCVLIMYFFQIYDAYIPEKVHHFMGKIADLSFGIYFIHYYFILLYFYPVAQRLGKDFWLMQANVFTFLVTFVVITAACVTLLLALKQIFGKNSRFVIGC